MSDFAILAPHFGDYSFPKVVVSCRVPNFSETPYSVFFLRIHGFKITNSNDHIMKNIVQMGPNFYITGISEEHCMCWSGKKEI